MTEGKILAVLTRMSNGERKREACKAEGINPRTVDEWLGDPERAAEIKRVFFGAYLTTLNVMAEAAPDIAQVVMERAANPNGMMADKNRIDALRLAIEAMQTLLHIAEPEKEVGKQNAGDETPAPAAWAPPTIRLKVQVENVPPQIIDQSADPAST